CRISPRSGGRSVSTWVGRCSDRLGGAEADEGCALEMCGVGGGGLGRGPVDAVVDRLGERRVADGARAGTRAPRLGPSPPGRWTPILVAVAPTLSSSCSEVP